MERLFRSLKIEWIPSLGCTSITDGKHGHQLLPNDLLQQRAPSPVQRLPPAKAEEKLNLLSGNS